MAAILLAIGALAYGVPMPAATFPAFVLYLLLGTAALPSCRFRWEPQASAA